MASVGRSDASPHAAGPEPNVDSMAVTFIAQRNRLSERAARRDQHDSRYGKEKRQVLIRYWLGRAQEDAAWLLEGRGAE